jgi:single-strand DNA-binding protein
MAGYLNKVQLIGNLGRDPEIRTMQSGGKVASFPVATTESWTDKRRGERREQTEWHRIVGFLCYREFATAGARDGLVSVIEGYLHKGSKVYVEGSLKTRKWTDQHNEERYSTEVVLQPYNGRLIMLDGANGREATNGRPSWDAPRDADPNDEIPF